MVGGDEKFIFKTFNIVVRGIKVKSPLGITESTYLHL